MVHAFNANQTDRDRDKDGYVFHSIDSLCVKDIETRRYLCSAVISLSLSFSIIFRKSCEIYIRFRISFPIHRPPLRCYGCVWLSFADVAGVGNAVCDWLARWKKSKRFISVACMCVIHFIPCHCLCHSCSLAPFSLFHQLKQSKWYIFSIFSSSLALSPSISVSLFGFIHIFSICFH